MFGTPSLQPRDGSGDWHGGVRSSPRSSASHVIRGAVLPPLTRERSVCANDVLTMSYRCPKGGSVLGGVGVDISLHIKHIARFTTPIDHNIPLDHSYATYPTCATRTPRLRCSAILRGGGCLFQVHLRYLLRFQSSLRVHGNTFGSDRPPNRRPLSAH